MREGIVQDSVDGILELHAVVHGYATENEGVVKNAVKAPSIRLPYCLFAGMVVIREQLVPFSLRSKRQLGIKTRFIEEYLYEAEKDRSSVLHLVRNHGGNILGLSEAKGVETIDGCLNTRIQIRPPSVIMGVTDHVRIRYGLLRLKILRLHLGLESVDEELTHEAAEIPVTSEYFLGMAEGVDGQLMLPLEEKQRVRHYLRICLDLIGADGCIKKDAGPIVEPEQEVDEILVAKDGIRRFSHLGTFRSVVLLDPDEGRAELFVERSLKFFKLFLLEGIGLLGFFLSFLCHIDTICMNKKV